MKLTSSLLLLAGLHLLPEIICAQRITLELKKAPLVLAFMEIHKLAGINFLYTDDLLKDTKPLTLSFADAPIGKVLEAVFRNQPVTYTLMDETVVVTAKEAKPQPSNDIVPKIAGSVSADGKPLRDISVMLKDSRTGTLTDDSGRFQLQNVPANSILLFTGIGYEQQEYQIRDGSPVVVELVHKISRLDETIVIAYGTTTKRFNTGSISKVSSSELKMQPVSDPLLALHGKVAGLYVQQSSGMPGTVVNVQLRGKSSIAGLNNPFFIIDGVPFNAASGSTFLIGATGIDMSPFSIFDPANIESIEVLKDADATAIYGSRGANGVILITTKKGLQGKPSVSVSLSGGAGRICKRLQLLNTEQYLAMRKTAFANDQATPQFYDYDVNGVWDTTAYTDWQKVLTGHSAENKNAGVEIGGGSANAAYRIEGDYHKDGTLVPGEFFQKKASANFRLTTSSFNKKFSIDIAADYYSIMSTLPQFNPYYSLNLPPNSPALYDSAGNLNYENATWNNPLSYFNEEHKSNADNITGRIEVAYMLLPDLILKVSGGLSNMHLSEIIKTPKTIYNPIYANLVENESSFSDNNTKTFIVEPQTNYKFNFHGNQINILAGGTFQQNGQHLRAVKGTGFNNIALMENLSAASAINVIGETSVLYRYLAGFGRIGYAYQNKYILNITGRRDGSSRFGSGNQFASFYAIGAGWIFSEERLLKQFQWLSFGKLRGSLGRTGNDQIPDYGYLNTYQPTAYQYLGVTGLSPVRLANPDYAWEINDKKEIALELGAFHDRIIVTSAYFRNLSSSQLVGYALPGTTGFNSIQANLPAKISNTGWEFEVNSINVSGPDFKWTSSFNVSFLKNKLLSYPNIQGSAYAYRYEIGKSLFVQERYHVTGINAAGLYTFEDVNSDGAITYPKDLRGLKTSSPTAFGGLQNTFSFRGFELVVFLQFVKQAAANYLNDIYSVAGTFGNKLQYSLRDYSTKEYTQDYASSTANNYSTLQRSDATISDASFIRVKTVSLSYSLQPTVLERIKFKRCQVFVNGQNLVTITHYEGWDPETIGQLPPIRTIIAGLQFTF